MPKAKPIRIQLSRRKGFKLPTGTINCARPGKWGNPFVVGTDGTREQCVKKHRRVCEIIIKYNPGCFNELRGKNLACWCRIGDLCHVDNYLDLANTDASDAEEPQDKQAPRRRRNN